MSYTDTVARSRSNLISRLGCWFVSDCPNLIRVRSAHKTGEVFLPKCGIIAVRWRSLPVTLRAMQPFSIRTTLTLADWRAYQRVCALRVRQRQKLANKWPFIALWLGVALAAATVVAAMKLELHRTSVTLGVIFGIALMIAAQRRSMGLTRPREGGSFLSHSEHELSAEGITSIKAGSRSFNQWQRVIEVTATTEHIFIWLDTLSAYVI